MNRFGKISFWLGVLYIGGTIAYYFYAFSVKDCPQGLPFPYEYHLVGRPCEFPLFAYVQYVWFGQFFISVSQLLTSFINLHKNGQYRKSLILFALVTMFATSFSGWQLQMSGFL